jgi:hypothetical protein
MALTTVDQGLLSTNAQYTGFKNRIINGAQVINQRNATVTTGSTFVTDRWQVDNISTSGSVSFAQNTTAPAGFTYSLKITVTSADAAVGATDLIDFRQWIEGYNIADMGFGTSNSNYFTCSFWVNSSQTGTYGVSFRNSDSSRVYVSTYTVNSASTWEQKTVTIPVDTSGTWLTDNSRGLGIAFTVMAGSNYQGTAGSWGATNNRTTSAQANLLATNGATFYITGVQLEKGSTATSFDYRPYGTELALCQRYFEKSFNTETAPSNGANSTSFSTEEGLMCGISTNRGSGQGTSTTYKVSKRAVPTITQYGNNSGLWGSTAANGGTPAFSASNTAIKIGTNSFVVNQQVTDGVFLLVSGHWTASAEL